MNQAVNTSSAAFTLRHALMEDLDAVKALCDRHRYELGFVLRPSLAAAIADGEIISAFNPDKRLAGIVHFHHRRDGQTTLYHLAVMPDFRLAGVGRLLINALRAEVRAYGHSVIRLKCPSGMPANQFYRRVGFICVAQDAGKSRALNIWEWYVV